MADCVDPVGMFDAFADGRRDALDAWHDGGRQGPEAGRDGCDGCPRRSWDGRPGPSPCRQYLLVHDPDGRPRPLRKSGGY